MPIEYIKALHIIFVVTWFAGLFYIVRLFIYHVEAQEKPELERKILQTQFKQMESRLWYIITWPSMLLVLTSGMWLAYTFNYWVQPWMLLKLAFVFGLILYHLHCGRVFKQLQNDTTTWSPLTLRIWNEVSTVFLVAIVFIVVLKNAFNWVWGVAGLALFAAFLLLAIRVYKKIRSKNKTEN